MALIEVGEFRSHSGIDLPFKINCDAFSDSDLGSIAALIATRFQFREAIGVPRGGLRLASLLAKYRRTEAPSVLLVDDVLTTGCSMEEARSGLPEPPEQVQGVVVFARATTPMWIVPIFVLYRAWF